jgi:hypothetical protein
VKWSIEGSNDGASWRALDERETQELNGGNAVKSFPCARREHLNSFFRFIRLIQTGPNSDNQHYLKFALLELFGALA